MHETLAPHLGSQAEFSDWLEDLAAQNRSARSTWRRCSRKPTPTDPGPYYRRVELQTAAGAKAAAVESCRKVLAIDPCNEDVTNKRAKPDAAK